MIAVGEDVSELEKKVWLNQFEWSNAGVDTSYCIFFTGRCGSTWLSTLIKETGLGGNPEEFFNDGVAKYYLKRQNQTVNGLNHYFGLVTEKEQTNGRFGMEIDVGRLRSMANFIDFGGLFSRSVIFFLYRRDIIAQAYSWATAKKSGIWHYFQKDRQEKVISDLPSFSELIEEIVRIRKNEEFMKDFFDTNNFDPIYIEYESLVTDPIGTLCLLLTELSIPLADINSLKKIGVGNTKPLVYEKKYSRLIEFYRQYEKIVKRLARERNSISSFELENLFR